MNRRQVLKTGIGAAGFVAVAGFGPPACSVSKDKAVRYADLAINYLKDTLPILPQIGGESVAALVNRALPTLEKLKQALESSNFPTAGNLFDTVTGVLGEIATALLQLPDTNKRNVVIGIVTLVNITLRTVSLFIETENPTNVAGDSVPKGVARAASTSGNALVKALQASRF